MKSYFLLFILIMSSKASFSQETIDVFEISRSGTSNQMRDAITVYPNKINIKNKDGYTPLIVACYSNNLDVSNYLMNNGGDINANSKMGTALIAAVFKGNIEIVKSLLKAKADVNLTDSNGMTALIYATINKNHEIVSLLIKAKANREIEDSLGNSALEYAVLAEDEKLIQLLKSK